jgi:hypothetical protein
MNYFFLVFVTFFYIGNLYAHDYTIDEKGLKPPKGMATVGSTHGEIAIDSKGLIYISVQGGAKAGVQIYNDNGEYLRNIPAAPKDFHGFVIQLEDGKEYLYGSRLNGQSIVKMSLKGEVMMTIDGALIPAKYKKKLKLTNVLVGPNGDIYAVDGYGIDFIHRFDKTGKYLNSFGGRKAPYNFNNCHKIFLDKRYTPSRILCCDRKNGRLVHLDLDGKVIGVYAENLRRPSGLAFFGDQLVVAEVFGRLTLMGKDAKVIKVISDNARITGGNNWPVSVWKSGLVITPHGVCFDKAGNILVSEFNRFGRILKYNVKQ